MTNPSRFKDANLTIHDFTNKALVVCPECGKCAMVIVKKGETPGSTLSCLHCHFSYYASSFKYHIILNTLCKSCEQHIKVEKRMQEKPIEELSVTCKKCKKKHIYHPKNNRVHISTTLVKGGIADDYFGCKLWLAASFRNEYFMAYNYEHLDYLKQYIGASLRERTSKELVTMVQRLPTFIKSAKNRAKLLKLIDKLEKK